MKKFLVCVSLFVFYGTNVEAIKVVNNTKLNDVQFEVMVNKSSVGCEPLKLDSHGTGVCEVAFFVNNAVKGKGSLKVNVFAKEVGKILMCKTKNSKKTNVPVKTGQGKDIDNKIVVTFSETSKGVYSCDM